MNRKISFIFISLFTLSYLSFSAPLPKLLWKTHVGTVSGHPVPLFTEEFIYIGNEEGQLICLDKSRGKEIWRLETEDAIMASPVLFDNKLFVTNKAGKLYCLRPKSGKEIWKFETNEKILCSPVGNNDLVFFYTKHKIWAIEKEVGIDMWDQDIFFNGFPELVIDDENIYFSDDMKVFSFSQKDGSKNWETNLPIFGVSDVALCKDKLLCMTPEKFYSINTADGKIAWEKELESDIKPHEVLSPVCHEELVFFTVKNVIFCYRVTDGELIYDIKDRSGLSRVFIGDNQLYFHNGKAFFFKPFDSKKRAEKLESTEPIASKFIYVSGPRAYFYNEHNELCAYSLK